MNQNASANASATADVKRCVKRVINETEPDNEPDIEQKPKKLCTAECEILDEINATLFSDEQMHFITQIMNANLLEVKAVKEIAIKLAELQKKNGTGKGVVNNDSEFVSMTKVFEKCNPLEREFKKKILALFRSMVYRTFDMSKDFYNIDDGFVLFEDIFKVKIYISKQDNAIDLDSYIQLMQQNLSHHSIMDTLEKDKKTKKEFSIYFGFPFFITIKIDSEGGFSYYRKQFDSLFTGVSDVDGVLYNGTSTTYQCLDIILANNFIRLMSAKKFSKGSDCLLSLINLIQTYKLFGNLFGYNKNKIYFEEFYSIYKLARINIASFPIL